MEVSQIMNIVAYGIFAISLICLSVIDAREMIIPDKFHVIILVLTVAQIIAGNEPGLIARLIGFIAVSLPMLVIAMFVDGAFGGGDIKLMAVSGAFLGCKLILISFVFAVLTGGTYGIWLLASKNKGRKEHFAFGPFLCVGMLIAIICGEQVLSWYLGLFL